MSDIGWNDFDVEIEDVTEEDVQDIESGGGEYPPIGLYRCTVIKSEPKQINFNAYSCIGTTLTFEINECLEIEGRLVFENDGQRYHGMEIFDDVAFAHEKEKPGMAKRRKYVALRLGIIQSGQSLRKDMWRDDVIGKQIILRLVENVYKDKKTGQDKVGRPQVGFFDGYESVNKKNQEQPANEGQTNDHWNDI
jgi:hypothetical protein